MKKVLVVTLCVFLACGCTEHWCEKMMDKPNKEWAGKDFEKFSAECIPEVDKNEARLK